MVDRRRRLGTAATLCSTFHQTGIEAQDGLLTMTYDGPRLDPVAVTMTMMSFIKHTVRCKG